MRAKIICDIVLGVGHKKVVGMKRLSLTDQDLSEILGVSVATVRLDRQTLGIPQLRDRMQKMAQDVSSQPMDLRSDVQILDLTPGEKGIALMTTTDSMLNSAGFIPAERLYGMAAGLAEAVVNKPFESTQVGNIKYKKPIGAGAALIARARVIRMRGQRQYVWVFITDRDSEVFRAKFIMNILADRGV